MATRLILIFSFLFLVCTGGVGWAQAIDWTKPFDLATIQNIDGKVWSGQVQNVNGKPRANIQNINGVVAGAAAASGDSCTGSLLFSWHMEDTTVTSGTPAGCSVGDTTATAGGAGHAAELSTTQKYDGSNSVYIPTSEDYYTFDWNTSTSAIVNVAVGRVDLWFYMEGIDVGMGLWNLAVDGNNRIYVYTDGNEYVGIIANFGGTACTARTNFPVYAAGGWYHVVAQWDQATAHGGLYCRVGCDQTTGLNNSNDNGTTQPGTWSGTSGLMIIGDYYNSATGPTYIDNLKVYNTWSD